MQPADKTKVFGIGWPRTGTKTLGQCLATLGYRGVSLRMDLARDVLAGNLSQVRTVARNHDAFEDWPWTLLFRELDQWFPQSRFILTTREPQEWIASYRRMLARQKTARGGNRWRDHVYKSPFAELSDQQLIERMLRHNREVTDHFATRKHSLLTINWEAGDGWKELCDFLECPLPDLPLPHSNRGDALSHMKRKALRTARNILRRLR